MRYRKHSKVRNVWLLQADHRKGSVMNKLLTLFAVLMAPTVVGSQSLAGANGVRSGITAAARHVFDYVFL